MAGGERSRTNKWNTLLLEKFITYLYGLRLNYFLSAREINYNSKKLSDLFSARNHLMIGILCSFVSFSFMLRVGLDLFHSFSDGANLKKKKNCHTYQEIRGDTTRKLFHEKNKEKLIFIRFAQVYWKHSHNYNHPWRKSINLREKIAYSSLGNMSVQHGYGRFYKHLINYLDKRNGNCILRNRDQLVSE